MTATTQTERILIVRLSAIGDVVHGLPVVTAIKRARPKTEIGWVVEGRTASLLEQHPAVDHVLKLPRGWYKSWSGLRAARQLVRDFAPQTTIDMQGLTKSAGLAWCSGAAVRIGFAGAEGREISPWLNNLRHAATSSHVVDKNLELLRFLNIPSRPVQFDLPINHELFQKLAQQEPLLKQGQDYLLINPGAGWHSKRWPLDRWATVARELHAQHGIVSLITWAPGEEEVWAKQIVAAAGSAARTAPPTSLLELIELARGARAFLSGDTGPLHLAAAVDTPCVALFGASDSRRNGPYGTGHQILQNTWLTGSSRSRRGADQAAISTISVEQVVAATQEILTPRVLQHAA